MGSAISCFAKGWRTLAAAGAFVLTGLFSVVGSIDMTPVVALIVKDPELIGAAMVGVGVLFGFLRYLSTTPIMSATHADHGAGSEVDEAPDLKRDVDVGA